MDARYQSSDSEAQELLDRLIDNGTLASTVLIVAPEGSGKKALALHCAARLLNDQTGGALRGENTDLSVFDYEDKLFKVDYARELKEEAFKSPAVADFRVFVIAHTQNMRPEAQNALLKLLEEPPARLYMFLLCENESVMLQTIRSRCLKVHLSPPEEVEGLDILRNDFPEIPDTELLAALRYAGGWPVAAEKHLREQESEKGRVLLELADSVIDAALGNDELGLWSLILEQDKPDRAFTIAFLGILQERLAMRIRQSPDESSLLRLDELVSKMQELVPLNVNAIHILQLFSQFFA